MRVLRSGEPVQSAGVDKSLYKDRLDKVLVPHPLGQDKDRLTQEAVKEVSAESAHSLPAWASQGSPDSVCKQETLFPIVSFPVANV